MSSTSIVQVSISINGEKQPDFNIDGVRSEKDEGYDPNLIAEDARTSNLSYNYSGRHDSGSLSKLKVNIDGNRRVAALMQAKELTGQLLTQKIEEEKELIVKKKENERVESPDEKRSRKE